MVVLLVLVLFGAAIGFDYYRTHRRPIVLILHGTCYTTPGYEWMGVLAQDGGKSIDTTFLGEGI